MGSAVGSLLPIVGAIAGAALAPATFGASLGLGSLAGAGAGAAAGGLAGTAGEALLGGQKLPSVSTPPQSQAAQMPNTMAAQQKMAGMGQAGGSPGIAQTFLTGSGGISPNLLKLGSSTLLGGGQ